MTTNTYEIFSDSLASVKAKVEKINRRAAKLGVEPITLEVIKGSEKMVKIDGDHYQKVEIRVSSEPVKLDGWKFVATLQHTDNGNIVRTVPGFELDTTAYRTVEAYCDHCKTVRNRIDTYLVQHEDGIYNQVGSSCLKDFLGHDPQSAIWMAQALIDLDAELEMDESFGGRSTKYMKTTDYLAWVSAAIRNDGWVSRGNARYDGSVATADLALNIWDWRGKGERPFSPDERDAEIVEKALAWIREQDEVNANDYIYNLIVACRNDFLTYREIGLVASLISAYSREQEKVIAAKKAAAVSEWVGKVGERLDFTLTVQGIIYNEGHYGVTYITKLVDESGNVFTWFASKELEQGQTYNIKATIKSHDEFRGVKQTIITRGKVN